MPLIHCDVEATGPVPALGRMTEFGMVDHTTGDWFHGKDDTKQIMQDAADWLSRKPGRAVLVSDNPAFDFMWLADAFWRHLGHCPFGHSGRRISDFYAGLTGDFYNTQKWKRLRVTPHDHNPVHDAQGNREALISLLANPPEGKPRPYHLDAAREAEIRAEERRKAEVHFATAWNRP